MMHLGGQAREGSEILTFQPVEKESRPAFAGIFCRRRRRRVRIANRADLLAQQGVRGFQEFGPSFAKYRTVAAIRDDPQAGGLASGISTIDWYSNFVLPGFSNQ